MVQKGQDILIAEQLLTAGKTVAIPTETVYGLAANGLNADAVLSIYQTKNRPLFNPLILHSNSLEKFEQWGVKITDDARKLAYAAMPGPVSILLKHNRKYIPDVVTSGLDTVAIRIPSHPLTLALLERLPFPLAAPSANPSNYISPTCAEHVEAQLGEKVSYILDGGPCSIGVESTIVSLIGNDVQILRYGGFAPERIEEILDKSIKDATHSSHVQAPGMLKKHYSPNIDFYIGIDKHIKDISNVAVLVFQELDNRIPANKQYILAPDGKLETAARRLFSGLRFLDSLDVQAILCDLVPNEGLGFAINDRILRAASK